VYVLLLAPQDPSLRNGKLTYRHDTISPPHRRFSFIIFVSPVINVSAFQPPLPTMSPPLLLQTVLSRIEIKI
jgi:hypothetical protein